jgi:hypothetical protein
MAPIALSLILVRGHDLLTIDHFAISRAGRPCILHRFLLFPRSFCYFMTCQEFGVSVVSEDRGRRRRDICVGQLAVATTTFRNRYFLRPFPELLHLQRSYRLLFLAELYTYEMQVMSVISFTLCQWASCLQSLENCHRTRAIVRIQFHLGRMFRRDI